MPPRRRRPPRSEDHAALGEAIRQIRLEAKLSQEQVAERASTDFTQVGRLERGTANPNYSTLLRIAAALDTSVDKIVSRAAKVGKSG
jgi:transcriptional regulator with XRE-family HTH domain